MTDSSRTEQDQRKEEATGRRTTWTTEASADGAVDENRPADLVAQDTTPGLAADGYRVNKLSRQHVAIPHGHQETPGQSMVEDEADEE